MSQNLSTNKEWTTPRLVARLEEATPGLGAAFNPAVASRSPAIDRLRGVVEFSYMGNAEFEFGTTRDAVDHFAAYVRKNKIIPLVVPVNLGKDKSVDIFVLCPRKFQKIVPRFLSQLASGELRTAEPTYFGETLAGQLEWPRPKGWFDLENQVLFSAERDIVEKVRNVMGIKTPFPANQTKTRGVGVVLPSPSMPVA